MYVAFMIASIWKYTEAVWVVFKDGCIFFLVAKQDTVMAYLNENLYSPNLATIP